jgi:hypothetical protein
MNHWGSDMAPGKRKKRDVARQQEPQMARQQESQMDRQRETEVDRRSVVEQDDYAVGLLRELIEKNRQLMARQQRT